MTTTKHPSIALQPVKSSQLAAIGHDPLTNTLAIQFKSKSGEGSVYHYQNFTPDQFEQFKKAESSGSYFKTHIKTETEKHPYIKVNQEDK